MLIDSATIRNWLIQDLTSRWYWGLKIYINTKMWLVKLQYSFSDISSHGRSTSVDHFYLCSLCFKILDVLAQDSCFKILSILRKLIEKWEVKNSKCTLGNHFHFLICVNFSKTESNIRPREYYLACYCSKWILDIYETNIASTRRVLVLHF